MLKKNNDGYYFVSENTGKMYSLDMGGTIGLCPAKTSDRCFILSTGLTEEEYESWQKGDKNLEIKEKIVGWFYGATFLEDDNYRDEYVKTIKEFVDEYESQVDYDFTFKDLDFFYGNIVDDGLAEFSKTQNGGWINQDNLDINIQVGNHNVKIPYTDDNYIRLNDFILDCRENTVEVKTEKKEVENMNLTKQNYIVKNVIVNSCYPEVFQSLFQLLVDNNIDGWNAMDFLAWLHKVAMDFQELNETEDCSKEIFFALYDSSEVDMLKDADVKYGEQLEDCFMNYKTVKYYRIEMTEDCGLEEIVPRVKTIDEQILETLLAYQMTNKEVLSEVHNKDLQDQIDYMRKKVEEN